MDKESFKGITNARPLSFGINNYRSCECKIGITINIYMADPFVVFQNWNP
jgi:hypothetical protein